MATRREQVQEWIEWSRQNLPETGHYPELDVTEIKGTECPWQGEIRSEFDEVGVGTTEGYGRRQEIVDELLAVFEDQLSRDPGDVSIRFTALNLYYAVSRYERTPYDCSEYSEEWEREQFAEKLPYLVRLLPVEDVCKDWRTIRWEIGNAYYIRDWERAGRLYDRLVALDLDNPDQAERHFLRGQFHFLRVLGPKINPKFDLRFWEPEHRTYSWSLVPAKEITLDAAERDRICDAAHDLRKGLINRADISPAYRSMLAFCYFATDDFHKAAEKYEQALYEFKERKKKTAKKLLDNKGAVQELIKQGLTFEEALAELGMSYGDTGSREVPLYTSIATSYQRAGDTEKAKDALKRCAGEFPNAKGIYKELARIQAQAADYRSAYESLTKELERDPTFGEDWLVSTALALGGVDSSEQIATRVENYLRSNPQRAEALESLLRTHWPSVGHLTDKARKKWIGGSYMILNLPVDVQLRQVLAGQAATLFATAVELELKAKVFGEFRNDVLQSSEFRSLAEQESSLPECRPFCLFLVGGRPMTLGQMHYVLRDCRDSKRDILRRFNHWVQKNRPLLLKKLRVLEKIYGIRGPAVHGSISKEDAERMPHLCRDFLSELLPSPQHETS